MASHQGQIFDLFAFLKVPNDYAPVSSRANFLSIRAHPVCANFPLEKENVDKSVSKL
jgi:hypothetical protein